MTTLNQYIQSLCRILQKEIDIVEAENMTDEKRDYFKGRISVLESVIDDLYRLRQTISTWRAKIGTAYYEDDLGRKRVKHAALLMWLREFDTSIIGKETSA